MKQGVIEVLVVEDSAVAAALLEHELSRDPGIHVMGMARDGQEAVDFVAKHKPDVIVMDLYMPKVDGFEATKQIMETNPVPIVAVTATLDASEMSMNFRTLQAGAVALLEKPRGPGHPDHLESTLKLLEMVKLMSEVKLVRRIPRLKNDTVGLLPAVPDTAPLRVSHRDIQIVAIGVSTGGPPVLQTILTALPKNLPVPIVIVQHIAQGFVDGMVQWLASASGFPVVIPRQGERLLAGLAYLAPDGSHLGVNKDGTTLLSKAEPEHGLRPAVGFLFRTIAENFGKNAAAVLLTGMGSDGADELKLLYDKGALTIAQDKESSLIHGMPGEAIRLNAAQHILPPNRIAALLAARLLHPQTSNQ